MRRGAGRGGLVTALLLGALASRAAAEPPRHVGLGVPGRPATDSCATCHGALDDPRLRAPATVTTDIHRRQGISCAGCHGGDPTADDQEQAMSPAKGFRGRFAPAAVPALCGSCHSDAALMLRYAPNIPTDQLEQYRTSGHARALAKGSRDAAVCTSCHGVHDVLPASDARSPVYPTRLVGTCARCHANRALMQRYGKPGTEVADYERSVHYAALTRQNDLSAPTCKSCHGAHGATPPGVSSVSSVCGTCHVAQRERFDRSPHKDAFAAMQQPACEACHGNHAVVQPADGWIGVGPEQVCARCHTAADRGAAAAAGIAHALQQAATSMAGARGRVARVARAGMLMDDAEVALQDGAQALILARNEVHAVSVAQVQGRTDQVLAAGERTDRLAAAAEAELRYRRRGLSVSLAIVLVAMVALVLKLRAMERR